MASSSSSLLELQWIPRHHYHQHRPNLTRLRISAFKSPNTNRYSSSSSSSFDKIAIHIKKAKKAFDSNHSSSSPPDNIAIQRKKPFDSNHSSPSPLDEIAIQIKRAFESLKKPAVTAVVICLLLFYDPNSSAIAASGGRIGGNAFSSSRSSSSSSSSSSSRMYTVPRTSSDPRLSSSPYSAPYYGSSPFFGGGGGLYMGPAFGLGLGGFSSFSLIFVGFAAFVLVSGFLSDRSSSSQDGVLTDTQKTSVVKLQVGLLGLGKTLQQDFNRLAEKADTSTSEGLSYVLTEATLALLRHPDYCISCYSSVDVKRGIEDGENRFNQLSIEERGKFDEETLVNVNSIKRQSSKIRTSSGFNNEYIVVTILVAAEGKLKLQPINGTIDLKEALLKLGSIPRNKIMAVEVLWTPQNEKDALSERELLEDYPLLRPL
ncbi:unnamed protein product [Cochlearia groenlandica]